MLSHAKSPWRWPVAALLLTTAGVHLALVPEHLREAPYAGILFALLAASAFTLAGLLLTQDHPVLWTGAATLSLAAILAYVLSRWAGLPSMSDDIGDWLNPLGVVALCSEAATALICWHVLRTRRSAAPVFRDGERKRYGEDRGGPNQGVGQEVARWVSE